MTKVNDALTVFEFGYLGVVDGALQSKRITHISKAAFFYLKALCLCEESESRFLTLKSIDNTEVLQVKNYAGVLFTPDGTQIEVLPKIGRNLEGINGKEKSRKSLLNMLNTLGTFRHIQTFSANLTTSKMPLLEVFISQFLDAVNVLVKRRLKSDYVSCESNSHFLRGKLLVAQQLRYNAINKHKFYVEHDEFLLDRPINRLIHKALGTVATYTQSSKNQKLLKELLFVFAEIPISRNVKNDLSAVKFDKGMTYYKVPFDWAKLVLEGFSPLTMQGESYALSLLFPLEAVFESYVASVLSKTSIGGMNIEKQVNSQSLAVFNSRKFFRLKPDLIINCDSSRVVLDTKWKLINSHKNNGTDKFGLSQSDLYQMFAYGHKYLGGDGELFLIYPSHDDFMEPLEYCFEYSDSLRLWVVPFDVSVAVADDERLKLPVLSNFQVVPKQTLLS